MACIVLRVSGPSLDVDRCRTLIPRIRPEQCFRVGEPRRLKSRGVHTESGFNLTIADSDDDPKSLRVGLERLATIAPQLQELFAEGASGELDCGIFVYPRAPSSLEVPPDMLTAIGACGLTLRVTAYPCSEEEDSDEPGARRS
jgi:hypothetical protein